MVLRNVKQSVRGLELDEGPIRCYVIEEHRQRHIDLNVIDVALDDVGDQTRPLAQLNERVYVWNVLEESRISRLPYDGE